MPLVHAQVRHCGGDLGKHSYAEPGRQLTSPPGHREPHLVRNETRFLGNSEFFLEAPLYWKKGVPYEMGAKKRTQKALFP